ncbi:MAG TPA: 2-oxoacid:acceptor oxidoreductase subunit alpha [Clostridiales bacterium]|nr:2-oxoacid:acceptor oxidoreductase subunit alpha [Clostridiales bacterium]
MYNILVGGAAGQGIDTTVSTLEKFLKKSGYYVFSTRDVMSRVRGGHNFSIIRFGSEALPSHSYLLDGIIAFNLETITEHKDKLKDNGFILCDSNLPTDDPKAIKLNMEETARNIGNPRVFGIIATGVLLKLFGENLDYAEEVIKGSVKSQYFDINIRAIQEGYNMVDARYDHIDSDFKDWLLISGNQSIALGAIAGGLKFYAAYPMSPSTSIMEYLATKSMTADIVVEQAEDEIAAINMAIGGYYAGARSMTGTSGGGFSLMVEALGLSGIAEIPLVVVNVQRPGPATGLPTRTEQSDLKFVVSASHGEFPRMVMAVRDHRDAFYQTARAFELAEKYQIPVIILSDQYLADSIATVEPFDISKYPLPLHKVSEDAGEEYLRYKFTEDGISPRRIPGETKALVSADSDEHTERGWITESSEVRIKMMDKRLLKLKKLKEDLIEPEVIGPEDSDTFLIGWGSTYGPIKEAIKILNSDKDNNKYGALVFGDVYPLPTKTLLGKSKTAKKLINVEQNATGQLAGLIREYTGIECTSSILKYDGRQISAEEIVEVVRKGGQ